MERAAGADLHEVAPALASGCTVVVKPSPETVLDQCVVAEAAEEAGLPAGVLNIVQGGRSSARISCRTLKSTRSRSPARPRPGDRSPRRAGTCCRRCRSSSAASPPRSSSTTPDLESNIESFFGVTLFNSGQTCWLNSRVLAPRSRYDDVLDIVGGLLGGVTVGDPLDPPPRLGR